MRIRFLPLDRRLASARLRGYIPATQLARVGFDVVAGPADWVVLAKHGWDDSAAKDAKRIVFDVCDDHFNGPHAAHYRKWVARADIVTCNSTAMAAIIKRETGAQARVIPDPYESPECPPRCHSPVLWFGQASNLADLAPILDKLPDMLIVSDLDHPQIVRWTPEAMDAAWNVCGLTVIPTGKKQGKSANRAVESIRRGVFPVCGRLPAYDELGLGVEDVPAGVHGALSTPSETVERVRELQDVVRDRFSPETIGLLWAECFV